MYVQLLHIHKGRPDPLQGFLYCRLNMKRYSTNTENMPTWNLDYATWQKKKGVHTKYADWSLGRPILAVLEKMQKEIKLHPTGGKIQRSKRRVEPINQEI